MPPIPAKRRGPGRPSLSAGSGRSGRTGGRGGGRSGRGGRGLLLRLPPRPAGVAGKTDINDNPNLERASDSEESSEDLLGPNNTCNNDDSTSNSGKSDCLILCYVSLCWNVVARTLLILYFCQFIFLASTDVDMDGKGETNQDDVQVEALPDVSGAGTTSTASNQQDDAETDDRTGNGGIVKEKDDDRSKNENPNQSEDEDETAKRYPRRAQQPTSLEDTGLPPLLANMGWGGKQIKVTIRIEGGSLQTTSPSLLGGSPRLGGRGGRGRGGRGREYFVSFVTSR